MTSTQEIRDWLDRLNELVAKGTPGPWRAEPNTRLRKGCMCLSCWEPIPGSWDVYPVDGPDCPIHSCCHAIHVSEADAALIAAAVNALPRLSTAVRTMANFADVLDESGDPGPVVAHQIRKYLTEALMDKEMSR